MLTNRLSGKTSIITVATVVVNKRYMKDVDSGSTRLVYIGRPSKWGNPFTHLVQANTLAKFKVATREEAISKYEDWLRSKPYLLKAVKRELKGKILVCWCKPAACHGDVLAKIANESVDVDVD